MNTNYKKKGLIFFGFFAFVLVVSWMSIDAVFYEDGFYVHYARSVLKDLDLNIVNQVPPGFNKIVTSRFSHTAHHSINQTPSLIVLRYVQVFFEMILGRGFIEPFKLAGILLSFVSLVLGFIFTKESAKQFNLDLKVSHFLFFLFTTSLFYFSFFNLTVIEIFNFAVSAYALNCILILSRGNTKRVDVFALGVALGMLVTSKITFLPLFLTGIYYIFKSPAREKLKRVFWFPAGVLCVCTYCFLKDFASFGELSLISRAMTEFTTGLSWTDLYFTIRLGFLGEGGLFYSNPVFLLGFLGFICLVVRNYKTENNLMVLLIGLLAWLFMGFFQTIFIVGPMLEDHYVGRIVLTCLPLMILGFAYLDSLIKFSFARFLKFIVFIGLFLWQGYTLVSFLTIYATGHYSYAATKTVSTLSLLLDHVHTVVKYNNYLIGQDLPLFVTFSFFTSLALCFLIQRREKLFNFLNGYFRYSVTLLIVLSVINCFQSNKNGKAFLTENNLMDQVTIADHYSVYSFIYIVDILHSQRLNSKDAELRQMVSNKHLSFLESVEPHLIQASPELRDAIRNKNLDYGFFR